MKPYFLIILLLFVGCEPAKTTYTQNTQSTPAVNKTVDLNSENIKAGRVKLIEDAKPQLARGGVKISLEGENKNIIVINSQSLSNHETTMMLRDSLENMSNVGVTEIRMTDKTGETRVLNLKDLDKPIL